MVDSRVDRAGPQEMCFVFFLWTCSSWRYIIAFPNVFIVLLELQSSFGETISLRRMVKLLHDLGRRKSESWLITSCHSPEALSLPQIHPVFSPFYLLSHRSLRSWKLAINVFHWGSDWLVAETDSRSPNPVSAIVRGIQSFGSHQHRLYNQMIVLKWEFGSEKLKCRICWWSLHQEGWSIRIRSEKWIVREFIAFHEHKMSQNS
jgi:hypothetical protein